MGTVGENTNRLSILSTIKQIKALIDIEQPLIYQTKYDTDLHVVSQASHRNWAIKYNSLFYDFSMTNLNFPWLRNAQTQPLGDILLIFCFAWSSQFSNSMKYLDQKMKFHNSSMTSGIFPKIYHFSRPGKCIFKFPDFSWQYEPCLKPLICWTNHDIDLQSKTSDMYLFD